jgi:glycosyltransferase involved in cell wall biosynthesis
MPVPSIDICLATWNGAAHLQELLDSLDRQTDQDWRLLVRDDGSSDQTRQILDRWATAHAGRFGWVADSKSLPGALGNFAALLAASTAPLVMCCDQDDLWHADKVAVTRHAMGRLQQQYGDDGPLLVHSDLRVVDHTLVELAHSFWAYQAINPKADSLARLLVQNIVTGCAMMVNRACLQRGLPIPDGAIMHDWWLALIAAAEGAITYIPQPTIDYRQHGANTVGAKGYQDEFWNRLRQIRPPRLAHRADIGDNLRQAHALLHHYGERLAPRQRQVIRDFLRLADAGFWTRRWLIFRHGFWRCGLRRKLLLIIKI